MRISAAIGLTAAALALAVGPAKAQTDWPARTVTVVVPVNPGGGADAQAHLTAEGLSKVLGQTFVLDFRPGASMMLGSNLVVRSKPDGYTILFSASTAVVNAALNPNVPYDPEVDLLPVARTTGTPSYISAHIKAPFDTYDELIEYAKANPGKVNAGVAGIGSTGHFSMSVVESKQGVKFNMVPYTGAGAILPDLMSGTVDITFGNATGYISAVKAGRVKYIAAMSKNRSPLFPDVPAIGESKYPGAYASSWYGITVPKGTPPEIVRKLNEATVTVLKDPEVVKRISALGFDVIAGTPEEMGQEIKEGIAEKKALIDSGIITLK
ncbi:MAG: tripartite tricarboxylate transporter substrate binding protein [Acetobacterales bacterium]